MDPEQGDVFSKLQPSVKKIFTIITTICIIALPFLVFYSSESGVQETLIVVSIFLAITQLLILLYPRG